MNSKVSQCFGNRIAFSIIIPRKKIKLASEDGNYESAHPIRYGTPFEGPSCFLQLKIHLTALQALILYTTMISDLFLYRTSYSFLSCTSFLLFIHRDYGVWNASTTLCRCALFFETYVLFHFYRSWKTSVSTITEYFILFYLFHFLSCPLSAISVLYLWCKGQVPVW